MELQHKINHFYSNCQDTKDQALHRLQHLSHSGLGLVNKIQPGEFVIDVGCGCNIFKEYIPNLVGIDPVYDEADYKLALLDFVTDKKFDVAFCLGSIQFGSIDFIYQQIEHLTGLLTHRARIYWRHSPKLTIESHLPKIDWKLENITAMAHKFEFSVVDHAIEHTHNRTGIRLYTEWVRN
jgi:hypothetical protein